MSTITLSETPDSAGLERISNDERFISIGGALQTALRVGNRWRLVLTYTNLIGDRRRNVWSDLMQLDSINRGHVDMSLLGYTRAGAGGGSPQLNGALLAGARSLVIDTASNSITNWLRKADFITIGNELKFVETDTNTNGSGQATISIWPELHHNFADNTVVNIATPFGIFFNDNLNDAFPISPAVGDWLSDSIIMTLQEDVLA